MGVPDPRERVREWERGEKDRKGAGRRRIGGKGREGTGDRRRKRG